MTLSHKSILVLDDEFDIVAIIKDTLQKQQQQQQHGIDVYAFTDPLLALEHFQLNFKDYVLVLSDIRMPGMNGFEFVKRVRAINPIIKVLLMSAFNISDCEFSNPLSSISVDGFVQKPISLRDLKSTIQKYTNGVNKKTIIKSHKS